MIKKWGENVPKFCVVFITSFKYKMKLRKNNGKFKINKKLLEAITL